MCYFKDQPVTPPCSGRDIILQARAVRRLLDASLHAHVHVCGGKGQKDGKTWTFVSGETMRQSSITTTLPRRPMTRPNQAAVLAR